jgi:carbon storage regulator CsrA
MLILTRRQGESICIRLEDGRDIMIRYLRRNSNKCITLGIEAEKSINIVRSELSNNNEKIVENALD